MSQTFCTEVWCGGWPWPAAKHHSVTHSHQDMRVEIRKGHCSKSRDEKKGTSIPSEVFSVSSKYEEA